MLEKLPNYYDFLGITTKATILEIKTAFRRKAKEFHPDVSNRCDAEEAFCYLCEAYRTLKDNKKRKEYDTQLMIEIFDKQITRPRWYRK